MTIEDIRRLEREAQEELRQKYHANDEENQTNDTLDPPDYEKELGTLVFMFVTTECITRA